MGVCDRSEVSRSRSRRLSAVRSSRVNSFIEAPVHRNIFDILRLIGVHSNLWDPRAVSIRVRCLGRASIRSWLLRFLSCTYTPFDLCPFLVIVSIEVSGAGVLRDIQEDAVPAVGIVHKEIGEEGADVLPGVLAPHRHVGTDRKRFEGIKFVPVLREKLADANRVVCGVRRMKSIGGVDINADEFLVVLEAEGLRSMGAA